MCQQIDFWRASSSNPLITRRSFWSYLEKTCENLEKPSRTPVEHQYCFYQRHSQTLRTKHYTNNTLRKPSKALQRNLLPNSNQENGDQLTDAMNTLGMAVCTGSLAASAGKAHLFLGRAGWAKPRLRFVSFVRDLNLVLLKVIFYF